jgi:hypothetical protein
LLTLFAETLRMLPKVSIPPSKLPRMADFALLGEAMSRVLGRPEGSFLKRYAKKRRANVAMTLDASPAGAAILAYLEKHPKGVRGLVSTVFEKLKPCMPDDPNAPRTARGLGNALRRVAPALAQVGIVVSFGERGEAGIECSIEYEHRAKKQTLH